MNNHMESELARLPEPVAPAAFVTTVMARVSRLRETPAPASCASRASMGDSPVEPVGFLSDLPAWMAALAGLAIVWLWWINGRHAPDPFPNLISSRIGSPALVWMPLDGSGVLGPALGLLLYLAGLFSPLRSRAPGPQSSKGSRHAKER